MSFSISVTLRRAASRQLWRAPSEIRMQSSSAAAAVKKAESSYKIVQSSEGFEKAQADRPAFSADRPIEVTKHPNPEWKYGQGTGSQNETPISHKEVDPYAEGRPMVNNYRLLVAGIAPRPIGLVSTVSGDGKSKNLSPFSYFQVVDHDPPMFIVGFSSRPGREKDTFRNIKETKECVINTVSENMIEAVSASSINAPYGVSEWDVSGLQEAPTSTVKPSRVRESIFSIESKVVDIKEFEGHSEGMSTAGLVLLKATRFWVREDATNDQVSDIDLEKLRPVAQLGGISYGRVTSTYELPRKTWESESPNNPFLSELEQKAK